MVTVDELKKKFDEFGYKATEELLYDAYNALCMFHDKDLNPGQDIFAICLEGPPGAGKTEFAKVYTKSCSEIFGTDVKMVEYQCDATTGKTELFEDINISAAIRGDADHVNIPGKLIEAIKAVNLGKKVVLFIDEYDKAREETDAFLLQFLQSGKLNSTQHGDLEVLDMYKHNLQVILCKNDMREELSGPLSRRIRITRLSEMEPNTFYQVAHRALIDKRKDKVDSGLLNLVSLMYEKAYNEKELFNRLPSCSEMLIAISDADRLLKRASAPQHIIYNVIMRNMFKSVDDIRTFDKILEKAKSSGDSKLADLVEKMKQKEEDTNAPVALGDLIANTMFADQSKTLQDRIQEMEQLISEYRAKFAEMEAKRKQAIDDEVQRILLENGKLVSNFSIPNIINNFEDESAHVKRGFSIFGLSEKDWVDVGEIRIPGLSHHLFIDKLKEHASSLDIKLYENGVLLKEDGDQKLIVVCDLDEDGDQRYRIMASNAVVPSTYVSDIKNFISFAVEAYDDQAKTGKQIVGAVTGVSKGAFSINALAYSDTALDFESVKDSVYNVNVDGRVEDLSSLDDVISQASCSDPSKATLASEEIMMGKGKVK